MMKILNESRLIGPALVAGLAILMAGCAGPRYATEVRYVPPTNEQGQACIQGCQTEMRACQADCESRRQACIANVQPKADAAFEQALRLYESQRKVYMRERRFYELDRTLSFGFSRQPFYYGYRDPFWYTNHYFNGPPVPPEAPSRAAIREQLVSEECDVDCGCQPAFDQCYVGCGGEVERRVVCIENCAESAQEYRAPTKPADQQGRD